VKLSIDIVTLFPDMVWGPLGHSILGKALEAGLIDVAVTDVRAFAADKHHVTDDAPYGGGAGMVMKPEPLVAAIEAARARLGQGAHVILMDPQGAPFSQRRARELSEKDNLVLVCGRYEGVDERVRGFVDEELSLGDFVMTGGELAALCVLDAVARLRPGVVGNAESLQHESFADVLLEGPHYTRPPEFRGSKVPEVLLSGDHARVSRWRHVQALRRTRERRPDLFARLPEEQRALAQAESLEDLD